MSVLRRRIAAQPHHARRHAQAHLTPIAGDGAAAGWQSHPSPPMPMVMPLTIVEVTADMTTVREAQPLWAGPRGQTVPATGPGMWQQLHAAGRP